MKIKKLPYSISVCQVEDYTLVNPDIPFTFLQKTDEENSLVCQTENVPQNTIQREDGWRAFRIEGVLDFSLIGILSRIASLLANRELSIFALSTWNTDYVLIKEEKFEKALSVLSENGYEII